MQPASQRFITVAVHTCERALALKERLERAGIFVTLQNINLEHPVVSSGMRVRIQESDLPKALVIIENEDVNDNFVEAAERPEILVPVDFSDYSVQAAKAAARVAKNHEAKLTLLTALHNPRHASIHQLTDSLTYEAGVVGNHSSSNETVYNRLAELSSEIKEYSMHNGYGVQIDYIAQEGLPEEVIMQYVKEHHPMLIVMGTRGADKKERELIGSVTAEVLDSCRQPVMTIPEGFSSDDIFDLSRVLFFCNGDQCDILAIQRLHDLMKDLFPVITLGHLQSKRRGDITDALESLKKYCQANYPGSLFSIEQIPELDTETTCVDIEKTRDIQLIAVPNKRRSAFARFLNPGIAHRILFRADILMMVLPV